MKWLSVDPSWVLLVEKMMLEDAMANGTSKLDLFGGEDDTKLFSGTYKLELLIGHNVNNCGIWFIILLRVWQLRVHQATFTSV
jgi:hypothetical protein